MYKKPSEAMKTKPDNLKIIIVDEEIESGFLVQRILCDLNHYDIRYFRNFKSATETIKYWIPDLIFIDIQSNEISNGIEFLKYIESEIIHTHVVVISDTEDAIKEVIHYSIIDFIGKPAEKEAIVRSIDRFRKHKDIHGAEPEKVRTENKNNHLIEINSNKEVRYYQPNRLIMVEADGNYSHLYMEDGRKETVTQNLGKLEEKLPSGQFIRISRKSIVNSAYIRRLNKQSGEMELECNGIKLKTIASMKYINNTNW